MNKFGFQNLEIYQLAKLLVIENYEITRLFSEKEKYGLVSQMNRAAVSIPSNIAEGYARESKKDKCHFLNVAYGSLMELVCQHEIAKDLGYVDEPRFNCFSVNAHRLAVKISNFKSFLANKTDK